MAPQQTTKDIRQELHARAICVIIPTFNNAGTIADVVNSAKDYCDDVFVVNDGSDDGTAEILSGISGIHVVSSERNRGKGHALKMGFNEALKEGFAYAITMDADGQHFAKDIPLFLEANRKWPGSVILGQRKKENIVRSKGSNFANSFSNFWFFVETGKKMEDTQTGFRLYPLKKLYGFRMMTSRYEAELELIVFAAWHGVGIHSIPVDVYYPPKEKRVSHFRPGPDFTRISILNTVLCFLAVLYGLPLYLLRKAATILRTLAALLFLIALIIVMVPTLSLYINIGKMTERKKWNLHLIIYRSARLMTRTLGIPGARFKESIDSEANFNKPSVIICNHQSHIDLLYLLSLSPRMIFLTKDWVWKSPVYGFLIHHAEYYPVSRGIDNLMPNFKSLVERGYSIAVFPEGTRSRDLRLGRFHQGAFYIADELHLDITPIYLYGTGRVLRKKTYFLKKSPVYMEVGKRIKNEDIKEKGTVLEQTRYFHHLYLRKYSEISDKIEQDV